MVPDVKTVIVDVAEVGIRMAVRSATIPMSLTRNESGSDEQRHAIRVVSALDSRYVAAWCS